MKGNFAKKAALTGLLSALAVISFTIENLFPPLFLPGARMGISNVFVLLAAILIGRSYAFFTLAVKCALGSLFAGNASALIYSLPAGIVALGAELFIFSAIKRAGIISASIVGATINSTVQNVVFCLATATASYLAYLPYLALIGAAGGLVVGLAVYFTVKIIPRRYAAESNDTEKKS